MLLIYSYICIRVPLEELLDFLLRLGEMEVLLAEAFRAELSLLTEGEDLSSIGTTLGCVGSLGVDLIELLKELRYLH